jgi:hypothetical protein
MDEACLQRRYLAMGIHVTIYEDKRNSFCITMATAINKHMIINFNLLALKIFPLHFILFSVEVVGRSALSPYHICKHKAHKFNNCHTEEDRADGEAVCVPVCDTSNRGVEGRFNCR